MRCKYVNLETLNLALIQDEKYVLNSMKSIGLIQFVQLTKLILLSNIKGILVENKLKKRS